MPDEPSSTLLLGWTTVESHADAERLARGLVETRLAACVQIDGPIASHYIWQGQVQTAHEYRLLVKFLPPHAAEVETWVLKHHSYETPEWIVLRAESVSEKYLSWARSNCTSRPL